MDNHTKSPTFIAQESKSIGRHATITQTCLILTPVFVFTPKCCMLSREAANINLNVFGLTRSGWSPLPSALEMSKLTITQSVNRENVCTYQLIHIMVEPSSLVF